MKRILTFIIIFLMAGASIDCQGEKLVFRRSKTTKAKVKRGNPHSRQWKHVKKAIDRAHRQAQTLPLSSQESITRKHYQTEIQKGNLWTHLQRKETTYSNHSKSTYRKANITTTVSQHDYSQVEYHPMEMISEKGYIISLSPKQFADLCHSVYLKKAKSDNIESEYLLEHDLDNNEGAIVWIPQSAVFGNTSSMVWLNDSQKTGSRVPSDNGIDASKEGPQGKSFGKTIEDVLSDCNEELSDPEYLHKLVELIEEMLSGGGDSGGGSSDDDDDTSDSGESSEAPAAQENFHQVCLRQP